MMDYEFHVTLEIDGEYECHTFTVAASGLPRSVDRTIQQIVKHKPQAQFHSMTYHHPPLEPRDNIADR